MDSHPMPLTKRMRFKWKMDERVGWRRQGGRVFQAKGTARAVALKCLAYKVSVARTKGEMLVERAEDGVR